MNELQYARKNLVDITKARVHRLEAALTTARQDQHAAERSLDEAIRADLASWHNTPGTLK